MGGTDDDAGLETADRELAFPVADTAPDVPEPDETDTSSTTTSAQQVAAAIEAEPADSAFANVGESELAQARRQLSEATVVAEFTGFTDYDRDTYDGGGWPDTDGDCQSDRHEILIEESLTETTLNAEGCRVETGLWVDPYDGVEYTNASDVSIDHVVALSAAHRAGAWQWDEESRRAFASDIAFPASHAAVGLDVNQAKADSGPEQWRPPLEDAWCRYAVDWTAVKARWSLAFTQAEVAALEEMLDTCEPVTQINTLAARAAGVSPTITVPETTTTSTTTSTTTTTTTTSTTTTQAPTTVAATAAPAPVRNCQGYNPCIEPGPDVDCAGGSGDGPRYIGRVSVTGSDPYGLDRDNNGIGCEG